MIEHRDQLIARVERRIQALRELSKVSQRWGGTAGHKYGHELRLMQDVLDYLKNHS